MATNLVRHDQSCYACGEDYIVLQGVSSEAEISNCPFCGSAEVGAYGAKPEPEDVAAPESDE